MAAGDPPPPWAYGFADAAPATPPAAPAPGGGCWRRWWTARAAAPAGAGAGHSLKKMPGSTGAFTLAQIRDAFGPADWFPAITRRCPTSSRTASGRTCAPAACATTRTARAVPENAGVAGLPVAYFIQTMADFKSDARKSADPRKANTNVMIAIAKGMTDEEIKAAAEYFRLDEVDAVDQGRRSEHGAEDAHRRRHVPQARGGGQGADRPAHHRGAGRHRAHRGASRSAFRVHSPTCRSAASRRARRWSRPGGGKTTQCAVCHGADLKGLGPVPGIAGRSPSYTVRQLYDMQQGTRKGVWTDLMKPVVAKLTNDDMLALAAYTAS